MTVTATLYPSGLLAVLDGSINWDADTIKVALVKSTYVPSDEHVGWPGFPGASEAEGDGYTSGGVVLTGLVRTLVGSEVQHTAEPIAWPTLTCADFQYLVIYKYDGIDNPLIAYAKLDDAVQSASAEDLNIWWASSGVVTVSRA